jgi:hypothetical protein
MDRDRVVERDQQMREQAEAARLRDLAGKVDAKKPGGADEKHVRDMEKRMADREVQQRDALDAMRGEGAAHRDGRVTPDVPDHLNNPDATVEDHIKDLERRANTAEAVDEDLERAARSERDAAAHSVPGSRPADPGAAADAADALHGSQSPTMPTDPANTRTDPQPAAEPVKASHEKAPEKAFGAPTGADKNATSGGSKAARQNAAREDAAKKDDAKK